jgi:hypothetical protein
MTLEKNDRASGAANDFYNIGFMAENNGLNTGAGSGKNRLSTLEEHDGYNHQPGTNYSDFPSNVSLVKNAAEPERGGFQDMGMFYAWYFSLSVGCSIYCVRVCGPYRCRQKWWGEAKCLYQVFGEWKVPAGTED